jgi:hypothetical protein
VIVDQRTEQVVRAGDRMEIAGEVQVDLFHGQHLTVAAARRATLHAEDGPQTRLAQREHGVGADASQRLRQSHTHGALAFAGRRRADGGDEHEATTRPVAAPARVAAWP